MGKKAPNSQWEPYQISRDHKPELPDEYKRIIANKGRIFPFTDEQGNKIGPYRVWHPNYPYPGLAMSRSLGDEVSHQFGVTSDPEISEYEIQPEDKYIILASDGIWEFLENEEVIDILSVGIDNGDYKKAAEDVVNQAHKQWTINDN